MAFGGSVKLTGESDYKKALSQITGELKVMSSQMQVVTATYGKNDTSVEGLTAKNKVLNEQIGKQSDKVSSLKEALENSKTEYGENSAKTLDWQTKLNKAEAELINMNKEVENNEKIMLSSGEATEENAQSIDKFGENVDDAGTKAISLGDIIKANLISEAIIGGIKALGSAVSSVKDSMVEALQGGAEYADNILTMSSVTGMSTDALQKYTAISELVDVSTETMTKSMAKNIKSMSSGADGYKKLGISIKDSNGELRNSEDVYWESIDALAKMENATEKDALAMQLFGKSAQELNPLMETGSAGIKELGDQAQRTGQIISEDALEALGDLDDNMQFTKSLTTGLSNTIAGAFAPAVSDMVYSLNIASAGFNNLVAAILNGDEGSIEEASIQFSESVSDMVTGLADCIPQMLSVAQNLIGTLADVLVENLPVILDAGIGILSTLLNGIVESLPKILPVMVKAVMSIVKAIIDNLPLVIQAGITIIVELVKGIAQSLPELIPAIVDAVITIVETLIDNIDLIIDAGIQIILGLAEGLINALPILIDKIPVIIEKLISAIVTNLPKLIEMGITLIVQLAVGLIKAIPQLISKIPEIIYSLVNGLGEGFGKMKEIGGNLIKGLWEGILNFKDWIFDKIKGFMSSITDGIKGFFGIHSPSTVFRDEIGKNLALGIGEGFADEMDSVNKTIQNSLESDFDLGLNTNLSNTIDKNNINGNSSNNHIALNFYPKTMTESDLEMAFTYMNRKYGLVF